MAGIGASSLGAIQIPGSPSGRLESFPVQGTFTRQPIPKPTPAIDRGLWITCERFDASSRLCPTICF
jgi:hypothetical protein